MFMMQPDDEMIDFELIMYAFNNAPNDYFSFN